MTITAPGPVTRMVRSLSAAAHIRALRHAGIPDTDIRARARITPEQMRRATRGDLIGWDIERRILAVRIPDPAALQAPAPGPGTHRRLRALAAHGWPLEYLADALGWPFDKTRRAVTRRRIHTLAEHLLVCALYDQRWAWIPEEHGVPAEAAQAARETARAAGYHPALAWNDDTIDVPTGRPSYGSPGARGLDHAAAHRALDGDKVPLSKQTRTYAITYAARHLDMPWDVVADRLGMKKPAVKRAWEHIKTRTRAEADGEETWVDAPRFTTLADAWRRSA